jgi:RimJ/RimL family protein N-acetyltransferase
MLDMLDAQRAYELGFVTEVVAHAEADNLASIRVLEKSGLTYQGHEGALVRYAAPLLG